MSRSLQIAEVAAEVAEEIMARSDLLINLVRSGASGDVNTLKKTVEAIVAEERAKQHNVVADRIEKAYRSVYGSNSPQHASKISHAPSEQVGRARDFITEIVPRRRLDDLIIPDTSAEAIRQLIEEQQRASILRSHSLEPRHSALFVGPPATVKRRSPKPSRRVLQYHFSLFVMKPLLVAFLERQLAGCGASSIMPKRHHACSFLMSSMQLARNVATFMKLAKSNASSHRYLCRWTICPAMLL